MNYLVAVDDCFLDMPAGMGRVAWDAAIAMRDRGHSVAMLCARRASSPSGPPIQESDGIRIVRFDRPVLPGWHPRRATRTIDAAGAALREHFGTETWDIVHMHAPLIGTGAMNAIGAGPRYVYTMHSPTVPEQRIHWSHQGWVGRLKMLLGLPQLRRIELRLLQQCQGIQTLSDFTKSQIELYHGLGDRVTVVPHWRRPDLRRTMEKAEARRRLDWPGDEKILFTLRHHGPRYGLDLAIRAIGPMAAQGRCVFYLGGDGPLRRTYEELARELGFAGRVRFTGRLSDDQVAWAYQGADLFVLPTVSLECFGLITLEAFAFGCPVLSTDACAIPETMRPIVPDFIVPAGDENALRVKVDDYLAGRLIPPSQERLVRYLDERFDATVVLPGLVKLLEG